MPNTVIFCEYIPVRNDQFEREVETGKYNWVSGKVISAHCTLETPWEAIIVKIDQQIQMTKSYWFDEYDGWFPLNMKKKGIHILEKQILK